MQMVGIPQKVLPFQATPYTWDEPSRFHKLLVEIENSKFSKEYSLDIIKSHKIITVDVKVVPFCLFVEMSTNFLCFFNRKLYLMKLMNIQCMPKCLLTAQPESFD